jgi:hypothetical protein
VIALQEYLASVITNVWMTIFDDAPTPAEPRPAVARALVARVGITGEQPCTVVIHCPESLARRIAARMLAVEDATLTTAEVQDALGEFANMAAGNLKAVLPTGHHLSLPEVTAEGCVLMTAPNLLLMRDQPVAGWRGDARLRDHCAIACDGHVLVVGVYAV